MFNNKEIQNLLKENVQHFPQLRKVFVCYVNPMITSNDESAYLTKVNKLCVSEAVTNVFRFCQKTGIKSKASLDSMKIFLYWFNLTIVLFPIF